MSYSLNAVAAVRLSSVTVLAAALAVMPTAAADPDTCDPVPSAENSCAGQPMQTWPLAQGNFTSPGDPGWVFFTPFFFQAGSTGPKADGSRRRRPARGPPTGQR